MCSLNVGKSAQGKVEITPGGVRVDHSKPLVAQVGNLGREYDAWTHDALPGVPRLFGPDWMEAFSKTPWFVIPIIWVPISVACMVASKERFSHTVTGVVWRCLVGIAVWYLLEYTLHRFAFHYVPKSRWGITFHFLLHGIHHKYPSDPLRLVFPLLPAVFMTAFLVSSFRLLLPWSELIPLASGVVLGYVMYDCTHYFVHHVETRHIPWLHTLRASHMEHHYRDHTHGYGITTSFFDWCCGTTNAQQHWFSPEKGE
jgi:dihydroceramide fatty acyl 2-hydroxylase